MSHACLDDAGSLLPVHHILKDTKILAKIRHFEPEYQNKMSNITNVS